MKLRYVNLLWFIALALSWSAIYIAWSFDHAAMQVKLNRMTGHAMDLEQELEKLKNPK